MKLSGFLNKPRWQAKEAAVRRAGVAEDDEPELLANLSSIARQDPDPGVRSAALRTPGSASSRAIDERFASSSASSSSATPARRTAASLACQRGLLRNPDSFIGTRRAAAPG